MFNNAGLYITGALHIETYNGATPLLYAPLFIIIALV
jgi:hypothetical protein